MKLIGGHNEHARQLPLHDYQTAAVDFILDRLFIQDEKGAGLFLDPGLGKTRTTLTALDLLFDLEAIEKALIVAPLRPLYSVWPAECREWGFPYRPIILHSQAESAMEFNREIELINFASLKKLAEIKNRWDIVVIDESTYVKNWSTQRMKFLKKMIKTIPKRIILTGTPAANSLQDLFSQMYVVDDGESLGTTLTKFRSLYCSPGGFQNRQWSVRGGSAQLLQKAIEDKVLRMQAEDYIDMPDLVENDIKIDMPKNIAAEYKRFEKELVAQLEEAEVYAMNSASAYIKCRQLASGPIYLIDEDGRRQPVPKTTAGFKYKVAHKAKFELLEEISESVNGKPILVFYNFKHELQELQSMKIGPYCVLRGGMNTNDVEKIIKDWNDDKYRFMFAQWRAASHGLNLQKGSCSDIFCFSLTDSPETYQQAIRRLYRQGSNNRQIRVHRGIVNGTVEEVQLQRVDGKLATEREFLEALKAQAKEHLKRSKAKR